MQFREMRRIKQQLTPEQCIEILRKNTYGTLSLSGEGGYPYGVPMNYVYENGKIFFHCAKSGHKIDAIKECDKVSFCVVDRCDVVKERLTAHYRSVIAFGRAKIPEEEKDISNAARVLGLKYNDDSEFVEKEITRSLNALCCIEITVEHMTGKQARELLNEK